MLEVSSNLPAILEQMLLYITITVKHLTSDKCFQYLDYGQVFPNITKLTFEDQEAIAVDVRQLNDCPLKTVKGPNEFDMS